MTPFLNECKYQRPREEYASGYQATRSEYNTVCLPQIVINVLRNDSPNSELLCLEM